MTNKTITKEAYQKLLSLARETIPALTNRADLKSQNSDQADFIETSVWSLDALIQKAYELGKTERENK